MKKILQILVWVIVLVAAGYAIYEFVLPEYPRKFVKSFVQPVVDSQAKTRIDQVKNSSVGKVKGIEGATYQTVLEKNTGMSCWVYELDEEKPGYEYVVYYGKGAGINLKNFTDYNGNMSTSSFVKFKFEIKDDKLNKVYPTIDGVDMYKGKSGDSQQGLHKKRDKEILDCIMQQLMNGMISDY